MSMHLFIPDPLAKELQARADAEGVSAEQVAIAAIQRQLADAGKLDELLAPVRSAFDESGMSEDESMDFLEAEKHAMREDRRATRK